MHGLISGVGMAGILANTNSGYRGWVLEVRNRGVTKVGILTHQNGVLFFLSSDKTPLGHETALLSS